MQVLTVIARISLALAALSALVISGDILLGHRQKMAVMNVVWPLTGFYFGPFALWAYFSFGRAPAGRSQVQVPEEQCEGRQQEVRRPGPGPDGSRPPAVAGTKGGERRGDGPPTWQQVFKGTSHCGAGCTLGDLIGEWTVFLAGWTLAGSAFWPQLMADFLLAFLIGIAFQYFAIAPMRNLGVREGLVAALKADTLSITAFEVGMFAWMALTRFVFFPQALKPTHPVYWLMMQTAMIVGFATSYPMNWWLIQRGLKERM